MDGSKADGDSTDKVKIEWGLLSDAYNITKKALALEINQCLSVIKPK